MNRKKYFLNVVNNFQINNRKILYVICEYIIRMKMLHSLINRKKNQRYLIIALILILSLMIISISGCIFQENNKPNIIIWKRTWGNKLNGSALNIAISSNVIYTTGSISRGYPYNEDVIILKYDLDGNLIWNRTWGERGTDIGRGIALDSSAVYITGSTANNDKLFHGGIFVLKYNFNGTLLWSRIWTVIPGDQSENWANDIAVDTSGIYITGDASTSSYNATHVIVLKYNLNGTLIWNRTLNGEDSTYATGIAIDSKAIFITGEDLSNLLLMKYDFDGNLIWNHIWNISGEQEPGFQPS